MTAPKRNTPSSTQAPARQLSLAALIADGDKVVAERFRTKPCRNFATKGSCPYESRCMFAHGRHQLRTKAMNLRDGLVTEEAIRQFKRGTTTRAKVGVSILAPSTETLWGHDSTPFCDPSLRNSTPSTELEDAVMSTHDSASELNSSVVRELEDEVTVSPELTLSSLCWYRRNPYDLNNTITHSPSSSSRASTASRHAHPFKESVARI